MFVISVLNGFCFLLFIVSFHYSNKHFVEVRNTCFNSVCLLKTLLSICKKQVYTRGIARIFKASRTPIKSFETVNIANTIQTVFTIGTHGTKVAKINMSNKYSQELLDSTKKSGADTIKSASKRAIKKSAEATGDLIGNKITDKIAKASKKKFRRRRS